MNSNDKLAEKEDKLNDLYLSHGWQYIDGKVHAYGQILPAIQPYRIALKAYAEADNSEARYQAMYKAFTLLWPEYVITYNYWMERMFREHCSDTSEMITFCGGAALGKTQAASFIGALYWLGNPTGRTVIVASTTLESLKSRIYGYVLRNLKEAQYTYEISATNSPPPNIQSKHNRDSIHGVYGIAASVADEQQAIKNLIGRHPKEGLLIVLDESTDLPPAILGAVPNLKKGISRFQLIALGNSVSKTDLHGALSTPLAGWESIDPMKDNRWETTHPYGVALYFNPYDSPAIHETDPVKKELLGKFLMTTAKLVEAEQQEGKNSASFWRFTMGFWKDAIEQNTIVSELLLAEYPVRESAIFNSHEDVIMVGGLDPAFSSGGDKCVLRLAVLGRHINGTRVLDFRGPQLVFILKILAIGISVEIQIAEQVIKICRQYNVNLNTLCVDASGAGRGLADVIGLKSEGMGTPAKIFSAKQSYRAIGKSRSNDLYITNAFTMWTAGREFIINKQVYNLDEVTLGQLSNRRIIDNKTLENKLEYRRRMASISTKLSGSPDEADAAMLVVQSAVMFYGFHLGDQLIAKTYEHPWEKAYHMRKQQLLAEQTAQIPKHATANFSKGLSSLVSRFPKSGNKLN